MKHDRPTTRAGGRTPSPRNESAASPMIAPRDHHGRLHEQRRRHVREDVPEDDRERRRRRSRPRPARSPPPAARAPRRARSGPSAGTRRDASAIVAVFERRARGSRRAEREDHVREGEHHVGRTGDDRVEPAAVVARDQAERDGDEHREHGREQPDDCIDARAPQISRENTSRPSSSVPSRCCDDGCARTCVEVGLRSALYGRDAAARRRADHEDERRRTGGDRHRPAQEPPAQDAPAARARARDRRSRRAAALDSRRPAIRIRGSSTE